MYWLIIITFILGVGSGVVLGRVVWGGKDDKNTSELEAKSNPFLDEEDREVADELRAEGAKSVEERIERRKGKILAKAIAEGRVTNDGVEELFCISDATASNYLKQLVVEKRLQKIGITGRGVYYEPV